MKTRTLELGQLCCSLHEEEMKTSSSNPEVFSAVILPGYEPVALTSLGNAPAAGHYTL